jgi:cytochrome c oxidase subunit 2
MERAARLIAALTFSAFWAVPGFAQDAPGDTGSAPSAWQMDLQAPATRVMEHISWFSWYTVIIMAAIVLFVVLLLAWVIFKFNERANPTPSRVTHHTTIEVLWTILPVLILVAIAVPSFRLLYAQYNPSIIYEDFDPETTPFLNLKVTGYQWYWGVEYGADEDGTSLGVTDPVTYDITMIQDADLDSTRGHLRNLSVDNPIVVPVNTFVRVQVTAGDVIHAFTIPAFGIKTDAIPGRLNETYFKAEREGMFYGQCSELCGQDHAYMPAAVLVVSADAFRTWIASAGTDLPAAYEQLAAFREAESNKTLAAK